MAGLMAATALEPNGGRLQVTLDANWEIWGPAGGYLAAIALRAVRERSPDGHRPVSLTGQFVRVAKSGSIDVHIDPVKEGASALYSITLEQGGAPVFLAQIWTTSRQDPSLPIRPISPEVPLPAQLRDLASIAAERELPVNKFWKNLESRPVNFRTHDDPPAEKNHQYRWMRFSEWAEEADPFLDAMRTALLIDLGIWPGHWHRLTTRAPYLAPSLDLAVQFHTYEPAGEWLLSDADSDVSAEGLISGRVRIWSEDGRVVASGTSQCLVVVPKPR